ncbi:MAG: hypothetical protein V2I33_04585 [Kangiellaceae bacterium]|jgi:hypothetical protein|nr:hypothetical protein [Kangiellaceae bacterium]
MDITYSIDNELDLVVFEVKGQIEPQRFIDKLAKLQEKDWPNKVVWDLTGSILAEYHKAEIDDLVYRVKGNPNPTARKVALVVSDELSQALMQMFKTLLELSEHVSPHSVFNNLEEAYRWLDINSDSLTVISN